MSEDRDTLVMQQRIRELSHSTIQKARAAERALAEWLATVDRKEEKK